MADSVREGLVVRPVRRGEVDRFNACLDEHHWLGHRIVGETLRYVACWGDRWVAVLGFGSAALACAPRDRWVGWSKEAQFARLRYVVSNQRFCVLPEGRRPNLASGVLGRVLRRLSGDYQASYGHPVLVAETFTDPARHRGSCHAAAGFTALGQTLGYRRSAGVYVHHGNPKLAWARPLRRDALGILSAAFDHPLLSASSVRRGRVIDLNVLALDGPDGLLEALERVPDPCAAWGPPPAGFGAGGRGRRDACRRAQLHRGRRVRRGAVPGGAGPPGGPPPPGHTPTRRPV